MNVSPGEKSGFEAGLDGKRRRRYDRMRGKGGGPVRIKGSGKNHGNAQQLESMARLYQVQ